MNTVLGIASAVHYEVYTSPIAVPTRYVIPRYLRSIWTVSHGYTLGRFSEI